MEITIVIDTNAMEFGGDMPQEVWALLQRAVRPVVTVIDDARIARCPLRDNCKRPAITVTR